MDSDINLDAIPLSTVNYEFKTLLSCLLNSKKILASDGPDKLPRDWRGLASLINISTEMVGSINEYPDKTARLLEIWMQKNDGTATLGKLMEYLERIDRFDVYDDVLDLIKRGRLFVPNTNQVALNNNLLTPHSHRDDLITYDDRRAGAPQFYHAYVLYANEDWEFVNELLTRMRARDFKLCTINDLEPGHETQYAPVSQLISKRCHRIILIYSPAFLNSPANKFYTDYAQAVAIESNQRNIIPIIYRECNLPVNLTYYHKLIYRPKDEWSPYNFWDKLSESLQLARPRVNGVISSHSAVNITELSSDIIGYTNIITTGNSSVSIGDLTEKVHLSQLEDTRSLSNVSQSSKTSEERKKNGFGKYLSVFNKLKYKKKLQS